MMQMLLSRCKCIFLCKWFLSRCKCGFLDIWCKCYLQICKMSILASWYKCSSLKIQMANFYFMVQMWISIPWCKCFLFHDANAFYQDAKCEFLFHDANTFQKCICRFFVVMQMLANVTLIKCFFSNQGSLMPPNQDFKQLNLFFHGSSFILIRLQCQLYLHCLRNK